MDRAVSLAFGYPHRQGEAHPRLDIPYEPCRLGRCDHDHGPAPSDHDEIVNREDFEMPWMTGWTSQHIPTDRRGAAGVPKFCILCWTPALDLTLHECRVLAAVGG